MAAASDGSVARTNDLATAAEGWFLAYLATENKAFIQRPGLAEETEARGLPELSQRFALLKEVWFPTTENSGETPRRRACLVG